MSKTAWIIGASSGIGRSLAIKLSQEGLNVILSARRETELVEVQKNLSSTAKSLVLPCNVVNLESMRMAFEKLSNFVKNPDLIIFAAGIYEPMYLKDYDHKICLDTLNVNLIGAFNLFSIIHPLALEKSSPLHLVWIASVAGYRGLLSSCAYGASKAALINFAETQKSELSQLNTKVQVVNPGFVKTRLTDRNSFKMPMIISSEKAADYIFKGLKSNRFEISFPPFFSFLMKILRFLPNSVFFKIACKMGENYRQ